MITSRFPWPPFTGDRLRSTIWLEALAGRAEVALIAPSGEIPAAAPPLRFFPAHRSLLRGAIGSARVIAGGLPLQSLLAAPYRWREAITRAEAEAGPFDTTIVVLSRLDPWVRQVLPAGFVILDAIDSLQRNTEERAAQTSGAARWFWHREAQRVARAEAAAAQAYERVLAVSEDDLDELGSRALAISNGVVIRPLASAPRRFDFGFWGRLAYFANADAAEYLLDEIWPRIRQRRAKATLVVAGAHVTNPVRRKANQEGVTLLSPVGQMPELARSVRVALLPLRYGSGESTKTMEAAEAGCAIVGMPKAFRGVPGLAAHARVATGADAFVEAAVALMDDEDERSRMGSALRAAAASSCARETTLVKLAEVALRDCA